MWWPKSQLHVEFTRLHLSYTEPREKVFQGIEELQPCTEQAVISHLMGVVARSTVQRSINLFLEHRIAFRAEGSIYLATRFYRHGHVLKCLECGRETGYREPPSSAPSSGLRSRAGSSRWGTPW
jgi:hypothetical protein